MIIEQLKNIINKYKNKFIITGRSPGNYKQNKLLFEQVNSKYPGFFQSISEIIYLIKNYENLIDLHIFCRCGNKNTFINSYIGYNKHCSTRCSTLDPKVKLKNKQTMLIRYNVEHNWKSKDPKLNGLETRSKKYVNGNYNNRIKAKETCLNNLDANGLNIYQRAIIKNKQTKLQRYKNENYNNTQQMLSVRKKLDKDGLNSYQRAFSKAKQTCIDKYGVDNYAKTKDFQDFIKEHQEEIQSKIYSTKKRNNTFTTSEPEEKVYQLLLTKFSKEDIERQYKSKNYPYACDFYIKSLDLYIEYNGTWTHGPELFNKDNPEHIKILEFYKSKNTKFYKSAIYTWTDLDVRKLNTFKDNNLNYKIFWNIDEVKNWINSSQEKYSL